MKKKKKQQESSNYARLSLLLSNVGMRALRLLLRKRYKALMNRELENGKIGEAFRREGVLKIKNGIQREKTGKGSVVKDLNISDFNKWDFPTWSHMLCMGINTGNNNDDDDLVDGLQMSQSPSKREAERKQHETESEAFKVLWSVQNNMDHISGRSRLSNRDFEDLWETAEEALLRLGAREKDIEHIRTCSIPNPHDLNNNTVVNADNEIKSKAFRTKAEELVADGEMYGAIDLYLDALDLSGLSAGERSSVLFEENETLLTLLETSEDAPLSDNDQACIDATMDDARFIIQLEPKGWKGYFLEGRCFQLRQLLHEAIDSFELALTLNPGSQKILNARSECRLDLSDIESQIHADPTFTSSRLSTLFKSRKEVHRLVRANERAVKSQDPVERVRALLFMGHRYQLGDEVPLDIEIAATGNFCKAVEEGSSEGEYYAGLNFLRGIGTKRNISVAVSLFDQAANSAAKPGLANLLHNEAIARAKAALGMLYEAGVGRARSYPDAAQWYTLAVEDGCGTAAMRLARMHFLGMGIPRDLKTALQYQTLAVELGSGGAGGLHFLGRLYAETGDLPQARYWSTRASASGYKGPPLERPDFDELLQHKEQQFQELKMKLPAHVSNSNVPIQTLHDRYGKRLGPEHSAIKDLTRELFPKLEIKSSESSAFNHPFSKAEPNRAEVKQFAMYIMKVQEYARLLLGAIKHRDIGLETIKLLLTKGSMRVRNNKQTSERKLKRLALTEFAAFYTAGVGDTVIISSMSTECRRKLMEAAMEFTTNVGRISDLDLSARICRLNLLIDSAPDEALLFATVCKALYPDEPHFHEMHAFALGLLGKHEEGVRVAEEGLKRFPNNWDLLYTRAQHVCRVEGPQPRNGSNPNGGISGNESGEESKPMKIACASKPKTRIQAYQEFIRRAPTGHPGIPEAHYQLAIFYQLSGNASEVDSQYRAGVEAEQSLLSHFLPYESTTKEAVKSSRKKLKDSTARFKTRSKLVLDRLLEVDEEEVEETRRLKLTNPKRTLVVTEWRRRLLSRDVTTIEAEERVIRRLGFKRTRTATIQKRQQGPTPEETPSLMMTCSSKLEDFDPTIDQVHKGRVINLTIMEEYIEENNNNQDPIQTVVKDDNDDFSLICLFNFDQSDPSTPRKLGFGSRIRLMNPYLSFGLSEYGGPVIRVDDPSSVLFLSSGEENPMCRYCWKPNPGQHCIKCKKVQYCEKECQTLDWEVFGHKILCKALRKQQQQR